MPASHPATPVTSSSSPPGLAPDLLAQARAAFARQAWKDAWAQLSAADAAQPLAPEDLARLATAAHLTGRDAETGAIWTRAHQGFLERGDAPGAARAAFWIALPLVLKGDRAQSAGWIARAQRLLDDGGHDVVERGWLLYANALRAALDGEGATARARFEEALRTGERFRDPDLIAMARHGLGRTLIYTGEGAAGVALLDETMAAVAAGEVSPMLVGDVYCSVISACDDIYDIGRAGAWTAALHDWCARQPEMSPYRGQCLVHRAEILRLRGAWPSATEEAERARECLLAPPPQRAVGDAFYQLGELHRLRGEGAAAEEAYRQASRAGRDPQPGLALLRLAEGKLEAARTAIARAMDDPAHWRRRVRIVPAYVEIALGAGDVAGARRAADQLCAVAAQGAVPFLRALSAHAEGAVLLAEGDARGALDALRRAATLWEELEAPYEAARTRVLIGLACRALRDEDAATLELDAAREAFEALGAAPDAARTAAMARAEAHAGDTTLTARETEVIRLIAAGRTNRAVAQALGISEKTAARHVSNIFTKLGLSSRSAATAWAYEHGLVERST